jgi:hypothetical protein
VHTAIEIGPAALWLPRACNGIPLGHLDADPAFRRLHNGGRRGCLAIWTPRGLSVLFVEEHVNEDRLGGCLAYGNKIASLRTVHVLRQRPEYTLKSHAEARFDAFCSISFILHRAVASLRDVRDPIQYWSRRCGGVSV